MLRALDMLLHLHQNGDGAGVLVGRAGRNRSKLERQSDAACFATNATIVGIQAERIEPTLIGIKALVQPVRVVRGSENVCGRNVLSIEGADKVGRGNSHASVMSFCQGCLAVDAH